MVASPPNRRPLCSELPLRLSKPDSSLNAAYCPSPRSSLPRRPQREPAVVPLVVPMRLLSMLLRRPVAGSV